LLLRSRGGCGQILAVAGRMWSEICVADTLRINVVTLWMLCGQKHLNDRGSFFDPHLHQIIIRFSLIIIFYFVLQEHASMLLFDLINCNIAVIRDMLEKHMKCILNTSFYNSVLHFIRNTSYL